MDLLAPRVLGRDPFDVEAIWADLNGSLSGRGGGMLVEAIAGIDIALWDIMGRSLGQPIHRLLGGVGRTHLPAYASSIMVGSLDETRAEAERLAESRFNAIKLKLSGNVQADLEKVALVRSIVGSAVQLYVDANWGYSVWQATEFSRRAAEFDIGWLEEPIPPHDREGYQLLARSAELPLAAGESEYTTHGIRDLVSSRSLAFVQPNVSRAGGITETRKIGLLAHAFDSYFAPHIGFSGVVCLAATMQLGAAAINFHSLETMVIPNLLREELGTEPIGHESMLGTDGRMPVPQGPGLGVDIDLRVLDRYRV